MSTLGALFGFASGGLCQSVRSCTPVSSGRSPLHPTVRGLIPSHGVHSWPHPITRSSQLVEELIVVVLYAHDVHRRLALQVGLVEHIRFDVLCFVDDELT